MANIVLDNTIIGKPVATSGDLPNPSIGPIAEGVVKNVINDNCLYVVKDGDWVPYSPPVDIGILSSGTISDSSLTYINNGSGLNKVTFSSIKTYVGNNSIISYTNNSVPVGTISEPLILAKMPFSGSIKYVSLVGSQSSPGLDAVITISISGTTVIGLGNLPILSVGAVSYPTSPGPTAAGGTFTANQTIGITYTISESEVSNLNLYIFYQ